jgi:hypothetical protein
MQHEHTHKIERGYFMQYTRMLKAIFMLLKRMTSATKEMMGCNNAIKGNSGIQSQCCNTGARSLLQYPYQMWLLQQCEVKSMLQRCGEGHGRGTRGWCFSFMINHKEHLKSFSEKKCLVYQPSYFKYHSSNYINNAIFFYTNFCHLM